MYSPANSLPILLEVRSRLGAFHGSPPCFMTISDTNYLLTNDLPILLKVLSRLRVSEKGSPCVVSISLNDRSLRSIYYNDRSHVPCPCLCHVPRRLPRSVYIALLNLEKAVAASVVLLKSIHLLLRYWK